MELTRDWTLNLELAKESIYENVTCNEFIDIMLIESFIKNNMGISYGNNKRYKNIRIRYENELMQVKEYLNLYDEYEKCFKTSHSFAKHCLGRVNAVKSLSMNIFHRPTRGQLCNENYIDIDIDNCHPSIIKCLVKKINPDLQIPELEKYCENCKEYRRKYAEEVNKDVEIIKILILRLTNGGSYEKWMKENDVKTLPIGLKELDKEMKMIGELIYENNNAIADRVLKEDPNKWDNETEKRNGIVSLFLLTIERIIQETAIKYLLKTNKSLKIANIIPAQDGFMIRKRDIDGIDIKELCDGISQHIFDRLDCKLGFSHKAFVDNGNIPIIQHYYRKTDEELYEQATKRVKSLLIQRTDYNIAEYIYSHYKEDLKYSKGNWYVYNDKKRLWDNREDLVSLLLSTVVVKGLNSIKRNVTCINERVKENINKLPSYELSGADLEEYNKLNNQFKKVFKKQKEEEHKQANNKELEDFKELLEVCIKSIHELGGKLQTTSCKKDFIKELISLCNDDKFESKINTLQYHLPIRDGKTFNMVTLEVRDRVKEDYFTDFCDVNFIEDLKEEDKKFFDKHFNDLSCNREDWVQAYLDIMKSQVSGVKIINVTLYIGEGCNGKSMALQNMKDMFGYFVDTVSNDIFLKNRNKSHINTQFEKLGKIRFGYAPDLPQGECDLESVKILTGEKSVDVRALQKTNTTMLLKGNIGGASNYMLKMPNDKANTRRWIIIGFDGKFENSPEYAITVNKKISEMFSYIMKRGVCRSKFELPECFKLKTEECFNDVSVDYLKQFVFENYVVKDEERPNKKQIRRNDFQMLYNEWLRKMKQPNDKRTQTAFTKSMQSYGIKIVERNHIYYYTNLWIEYSNDEGANEEENY